LFSKENSGSWMAKRFIVYLLLLLSLQRTKVEAGKATRSFYINCERHYDSFHYTALPLLSKSFLDFKEFLEIEILFLEIEILSGMPCTMSSQH
jgi:hypothetical protein